MKKILITLICLFSFTIINGQSKKEIAKVYINRAYEAIEDGVDFESARTFFEKAMNYTDTILNRKVATLGALIYFEVHHKRPTEKEQLVFLEKAQDYSTQYFNLSKNYTKTDEYADNTENYVLILESIEKLKISIKKQEQEELRKEKELKRIDSLKNAWKEKSDKLSIKVDSIYKFNKNSVALFKKNNYFGLINDLGEVLVEANQYLDVLNFDGFVIFKDKIEEPTILYCYNTNEKSGFKIPSISNFSRLSTHYGKVMLPRGNGRLVAYPNNSHNPFVYDLNEKKIVKVYNKKELFKDLKKADRIDKYNNDDEVKVGKNWYKFGGHLGGGIHPLYAIEGYKLEGFLCSIDGRFLRVNSGYQHLGYFYNNKFQASSASTTFWVNQNGTKVTEAKDEASLYLGNSKLMKLKNGGYQIIKENMIILGDEKLEKMVDFLRSHNN